MPERGGVVSPAKAIGPAENGRGISDAPGSPAALQAFRESFYACLGRRADALFELADAILTVGVCSRRPALASRPYIAGVGAAALSKGSMDEEALRELLVRFPLAEAAADRPAVYAVDVFPL